MILSYSIVKGMHHVDKQWTIETGLVGCAFMLTPYDPKKQGTAMTNTGKLVVQPGYLWDGSSGPTLDGKADPVPSLVHDVLYEAMRASKLSTSMRGAADKLYYALLRERGMSRTRAGLRWFGLRLVGWTAASPKRGPEYEKRSAS